MKHFTENDITPHSAVKGAGLLIYTVLFRYKCRQCGMAFERKVETNVPPATQMLEDEIYIDHWFRIPFIQKGGVS